ncbi:MAG: glycine zipper domain-containing protein [Caulobacteraceae bacterium]
MSMIDLTRKAGAAAVLAAMSLGAVVPSTASAQTAIPVPPPPAGDVNYPAEAPPAQGQYAPDAYDNQAPAPYAQNGAYAGHAPASNRPEDRQYRRDMRRYEQQRAAYDYNRCARSSQGRTVAGALLGGIAGAVIGSNAAPRWDRSGGALVGGAIGATAGAAVGSATAPVCGGYGGRYAYGPGPYAYGPGYGYGGPVIVGGPAYYGPSVGVVVGPRRYWGPRWGARRPWRRW